jgi:hypothetical protein
MESDLDILYMAGNIISRLFQWHWFLFQTHPESTGIVRGSWHPVSVPALWRRLSVFGPWIVLEPIRRVFRGSCMTLGSLLVAITPLFGFGFCLSYSIKNNSLLDRFVRPCWYFLTLTEKFASARKYCYSTSPESIQGIVFSTRNGCVTVF